MATEGQALASVKMLSGNEAIARGAWEAGVKVAAAYPGTPSTEILEALAGYEGVYGEWSPNEKVALEVGIGASVAGVRTLVSMKHVGLNVAADPFFSAAYIGVGGGLVIVSADDPGMHSSQGEQDNRTYGKFGRVPVLEPSDSSEAKEYTKIAFELSERFDTPVMLRTTTRTSHSKSAVELGERPPSEPVPKLTKNYQKHVMLPAHAIVRHPLIEQRVLELADYAETSPLNRIEMGDPRVGIVASGAAYVYAREAFPNASFLKLGMAYPLPPRLVAEFRKKVDRLYVIEELDPFLEEMIRTLGVEVDGGKELTGLLGEIDPALIARELTAAGAPGADEGLLEPVPVLDSSLPSRPPVLCPGCSHRGIFTVLRKLRVYVSGDIGCYTIGALPPLKSMHLQTCMGASISMAHGIDHATRDSEHKLVAVIGDSTFFHSGITSLMDIAYNKGRTLVVILDNRTTAMTGGQENPGSGKTLLAEPASIVDIPGLCRALGIERVSVVDPYDLEEVERVFREELAAADEPSVVIARAPCVLQFRVKQPPYRIDSDLCIGCKLCLQVSCVALNLLEDDDGRRTVEIRPDQCAGCGVCSQVCREGAILPPSSDGIGFRSTQRKEPS